MLHFVLSILLQLHTTGCLDVAAVVGGGPAAAGGVLGEGDETTNQG
jgi:hypothetical protein